MSCKTLEVIGMPEIPTVEVLDYGFAEVEGINSKFESPCQIDAENDQREAIFVRYKVSGISIFETKKIKFVSKYRNPLGIITTWTWEKTYTGLQNLTWTHYHWAITKKYAAGTYEFLSMTATMT